MRVVLPLGVLALVGFALLLWDHGDDRKAPELLDEQSAGGAASPLELGRGVRRASRLDAKIKRPATWTGSRFAEQHAPSWALEFLDGSCWQQRIQVGPLLARLVRELRAGTLDADSAGAALDWLRVFLLFREHDTFQEIGRLVQAGEPVEAARWLKILEVLTAKDVSLNTFELVGTQAQTDEIGSNCFVRVWTPKETAFDRAHIRESEAILRMLERISGTRSTHGFDVVAAPDMGASLIPRWVPYEGYIGLYFLGDDLAVIGTRHEAPRLQRLLNHELVHAWWDQGLRTWSSRFVAEGMATYFAWLRSTDTSLNVPERRLQDNLAAMVRIVDRLAAEGVDTKRFSLRTLVRAGPGAFYALGWFAYAIAQACFAYVPEETLLEAVRTRNEKVLLRAFESIRWSELLAWARLRAEGGNPDAAEFPRDAVGYADGMGHGSSRWSVEVTLTQLFGKTINAAVFEKALHGHARASPLLKPSHRAKVMAALLESSAGHVDVIFDATSVLELPVHEDAGASAPWLRGELPPADESVRGFTEKAVAWLRAENPKRPVTLGAAGETVAKVDRVAGDATTFRIKGLVEYLGTSKARTGGDLVLVVGQNDDVYREAVRKRIEDFYEHEPDAQQRLLHRRCVRYLAEWLITADWRAKRVLVIDVAVGESEGRVFAEAFEASSPPGALVSYWRLHP